MGSWGYRESGEDEGWWIEGPASAKTLARFRRLFPEDAEVVWESPAGSRTLCWGSLDREALAAGERLRLPAPPLGLGPVAYLVDRLTGPGGCEWCGRQTAESLVRFWLEESYEVAEAVLAGDPAGIQDELGDMLFEWAFMARATATAKADAVAAVVQKLIRRHPEVFSGDPPPEGDSTERRARWERLKSLDAPRTGESPWVFPALIQAKRLGRDQGTPETAVYRGVLDLLEVYTRQQPGKMEEILADAGWALATAADRRHLDAEWALFKRVTVARVGRRAGEALDQSD